MNFPLCCPHPTLNCVYPPFLPLVPFLLASEDKLPSQGYCKGLRHLLAGKWDINQNPRWKVPKFSAWKKSSKSHPNNTVELDSCPDLYSPRPGSSIHNSPPLMIGKPHFHHICQPESQENTPKSRSHSGIAYCSSGHHQEEQSQPRRTISILQSWQRRETSFSLLIYTPSGTRRERVDQHPTVSKNCNVAQGREGMKALLAE